MTKLEKMINYRKETQPKVMAILALLEYAENHLKNDLKQKEINTLDFTKDRINEFFFENKFNSNDEYFDKKEDIGKEIKNIIKILKNDRYIYKEIETAMKFFDTITKDKNSLKKLSFKSKERKSK